MEYIIELVTNELLMSAIAGWCVAQVIKAILDAALHGHFSPERLVGDGGMPSCHSATVCAMATAALELYGPGSFQFAITAILAIIVMHDAMGVRLQTGKQAKLLNELMEIIDAFEGIDFKDKDNKKLKELVGHTPLQVLVGGLIGIIIGFIIG